MDVQGDLKSRRLWPLLAAAGLTAALFGCGGGEAGASTAENDDLMESPATVRPVNRGPTGFGSGVTGGAGGKVVRVKTASELKRELCRTANGAGCTDNEPRIIELDSTIDLSDTEGTAQAQGCFATTVCTGAARSEITLMVYDWQRGYCANKPASSYRYKVAGLAGVLVGSNKTVIGVGRHAGIKGKGLDLKGGVQNIVIRNLSISDINEGMVWGGDALTLSDAKRVWIDHNRFARVGRMFLVTGTGDQRGVVDEVTVSNNEFDGRSAWSSGCDGKHYWNILLAGNGRLTMVGNWLHDFSGRGPRIDSGAPGATVHLVNNLFENGSWHALDYGGASTRVLSEGNHYVNVKVPVITGPAGSGQMFGFYRQNEATKAACHDALGRQCNPNVVKPLPDADFTVQDSAVLSTMKAVASRVIKPYSASDVPDTVRANAGVGKI